MNTATDTLTSRLDAFVARTAASREGSEYTPEECAEFEALKTEIRVRSEERARANPAQVFAYVRCAIASLKAAATKPLDTNRKGQGLWRARHAKGMACGALFETYFIDQDYTP